MVPAYAAYLALNNLTGKTRSWLMGGQGHCVAAVDALNVLTGNLHPEQRARYLAPEGLSRLASDFYSYRQKPDGTMAAPPLGSHVNPPHTAGGIIEGGYLGFAELQYAHMPLPGESLVPSFPTAPPKNSAAVTGYPPDGGVPRTADWSCR